MTEPRPEFALSFSPEAVHLLQRAGGDWAELGQARFDDTEMRQGLDALRQRIEIEAPGGHILRLVIPTDQILYTTLTLGPAPSPRQAVKNALDGLTPYPIGQLAFDWEAAEDGQARVAAVARQTLAEAEGFALRYGFAADRFIATPEGGAFPREPVFGLTDHARSGDPLPEPVFAAPVIAPVAAPVVVSRIVPHVVAEPLVVAPEPVVEPAPEAPVVAVEEAVVAEEVAAAKPVPDRARALIERANEARAQRLAAPTPTERAPRRPGARSGIGGVVPWAGGLVVAILLAWLLFPQGEPAPQEVAQQAVEAIEPLPEAEPVEVQTAEAPPAPAAPPAVDPAPDFAPRVAAHDDAQILSVADERPAPVTMAQAQTPQPAPVQPAPQPAATTPVTPPAQTIVRPSAAATPPSAFTTEPASTSTPAPAPAPAATLAESAVPPQAPEPAAQQAAITEALAEATGETTPPVPAPSAAPAATPTRTLAHSNRPIIRPATLRATSEAQAAQPQATGRFSGATLRSSARPSTAPTRSATPTAPDRGPAIPQNPQPFERVSEPEPSSKRPPAKPNRPEAMIQPAAPVEPLLQAGLRLTAGDRALLAGQFPAIADLPFPRRVAEKLAPVRYAQARPARKPQSDAATNSEAVDAALRRAVEASPPVRPAARGGTTSNAAATPAPTGGGLVRSARPPARVGGNTAAAAAPAAGGGSASIAGLSAATNAAVESAIASAVNQSTARPGAIALTALNSSSIPPRRTGQPEAPAQAAPAQTLSPTAVPNAAAAQAAAAQAALAERRRLDDELQAQAEARVRARAAEDAAAEARARSQAEARARAQAEAERTAAQRRNQQYRPQEIDDEPELSQPSGGGATSTTVASAATQSGAIDMSRATLIGVVGAGQASRGLIRLRNGRVVTVRLGDKIDGGTINAIGEGRVQYVKGGRPFELRILNGK